MTNKKVLILGCSGMLGTMCVKVLANTKLEIYGASRTIPNQSILPLLKQWYKFDISNFNNYQFINMLQINNIDYIINAAGITKHFIDEKSMKNRNMSIFVNSIFPSILSNFCENLNIRIIQIATDCVYSGKTDSAYSENSVHDAHDVYGKTKSLGEIIHPNINHIRCSIIGPDQCKNDYLLEWFLKHPVNANVGGYTNHLWNGVTTYSFAKVCHGIIQNNTTLPPIQHLVPNNIINKNSLLHCFAKYYNRADIKIQATKTSNAINRVITTINPDINNYIWQLAGYNAPPSIEQMIKELSECDL